jgi:hypothetical protein
VLPPPLEVAGLAAPARLAPGALPLQSSHPRVLVPRPGTGGAGGAAPHGLVAAHSSSGRPLVETAAARSARLAASLQRAAAVAAKTAKKTTSKTTKKTGSSGSTSRTRQPAPGYATAKTSPELAFLDDPSLSIEDKLAKFLMLVQQRTDRELVAHMKKMEEMRKALDAKKQAEAGAGRQAPSSGEVGKTEPKKKHGGFFSSLGDVLDAVKDAFTGPQLGKLVQQLGGPLLAAAATAVGLPQLAPVALTVGKELGKVAGEAVSHALDDGSAPARSTSSRGSTSGSSSTGSTASGGTSATGEVNEYSEQAAAMELQRLVQKQQRMFEMVSTILKSFHDTQMAMIHNMR